MTYKQRYVQISREEFGAALLNFELREVPKRFYLYHWEKNRAGSWKWTKREKEVWEICYVLEIYGNDNAGIIIYSSINRETGISRPRGEDAIRFVVVDKDLKPRSKERRMNRTGNWKQNLLTRILDLIKEWKYR